MIKKIHHVGIAVNKIDPVAEFLKDVFGAELLPGPGLETPEFLSRMVKMGENQLELLEPRGQNGLIERFLKARGEGIHHVSLLVDDVPALLKICEARGMTVLGRRFIHPRSAHGILIEFFGANERIG
jgi:methylmalonyl-CoA epimerase